MIKSTFKLIDKEAQDILNLPELQELTFIGTNRFTDKMKRHAHKFFKGVNITFYYANRSRIPSAYIVWETAKKLPEGVEGNIVNLNKVEVVPSKRIKGIGKKAIEEFKGDMKEQGYDGILLQTLSQSNIDLVAYYMSLGWKDLKNDKRDMILYLNTIKETIIDCVKFGMYKEALYLIKKL